MYINTPPTGRHRSITVYVKGCCARVRIVFILSRRQKMTKYNAVSVRVFIDINHHRGVCNTSIDGNRRGREHLDHNDLEHRQRFTF